MEESIILEIGFIVRITELIKPYIIKDMWQPSFTGW